MFDGNLKGGLKMMKRIRLDSKTFLAAYASAGIGVLIVVILLVWYLFLR